MQYNRQLITRLLVTFFICGLVIFGGIYIFNHGFLVVSNPRDKQSFSYTQLDSNRVPRSASFIGERKLLTSGVYSFSALSASGAWSFQTVTIPHFLSSVAVQQPKAEHLTTTVGRMATSNVALKNNILTSWSNEGVFLPIDSSNVSGDISGQTTDPNFPVFAQNVQISASIIGGVVKVNSGYQPIFYNINDSSLAYLPVVISNKPVFIQKTSAGFSVFNPTGKNITVYQPGQASPVRSFSLQATKPIASYNNKPLYSYEKNTVAVVTGPAMFDGGDGPSTNSQPLELTTINTRDKKQFTRLTLPDRSITSVSLSPTGEEVIIQGASSSSVYSTRTGKLKMVIPYSITQLIWKGDGTDFVFRASDAGIFIGSLVKKSGANLVPYSIARPTNLSFIEGDDIYYSAYTSKTDGNIKPDIYRSSLSKVSSAVSRSLLANFPHQGEGYYIDCLDNIITIQTTRYITDEGAFTDSGALKRAQDYIKLKIADTSSYTIQQQYVDMDIRTPSDDPSGGLDEG